MPKGYSLWLMPEGEVYDRLSAIISDLSSRYNAANFKPHVTLLGEVQGADIVKKTKQLAAGIAPYNIVLNRLEHRDEYFRCLFLRAEETSAVMGANDQARLVFNRQADHNYMPHLSLLYGHYSARVKEQIISEIGELNISFVVSSIHLFSAEGEPKNWYRVKSFPLRQH